MSDRRPPDLLVPDAVTLPDIYRVAREHLSDATLPIPLLRDTVSGEIVSVGAARPGGFYGGEEAPGTLADLMYALLPKTVRAAGYLGATLWGGGRLRIRDVLDTIRESEKWGRTRWR